MNILLAITSDTNVAIPLLNRIKIRSGYMGAKSLTITPLRLVMALINLVYLPLHIGADSGFDGFAKPKVHAEGRLAS